MTGTDGDAKRRPKPRAAHGAGCETMLRHATACDNESTTGEVGDATPRDRKRKSESNLQQDAALSCDVVQ